MSYLGRIKALNSEKQALKALPKLPKGAFDSFGSSQGGRFSENPPPANDSKAATAILAIPATDGGSSGGTVAKIATVAVANPTESKIHTSKPCAPNAKYTRFAYRDPEGHPGTLDYPYDGGATLAKVEAEALELIGPGCVITPLSAGDTP
jgi:hypothetical protein